MPAAFAIGARVLTAGHARADHSAQAITDGAHAPVRLLGLSAGTLTIVCSEEDCPGRPVGRDPLALGLPYASGALNLAGGITLFAQYPDLARMPGWLKGLPVSNLAVGMANRGLAVYRSVHPLKRSRVGVRSRPGSRKPRRARRESDLALGGGAAPGQNVPARVLRAPEIQTFRGVAVRRARHAPCVRDGKTLRGGGPWRSGEDIPAHAHRAPSR